MTVTRSRKCRKVGNGDLLPDGDGSFVMSESEAVMPPLLTITDDTTEADLLAMLQTCSRYPPSAQRTDGTDTLLDLLLEWAGVSVTDTEAATT